MAIDIDGFGVLRAIASKPELFPNIKSDAVKAARALTTKQLKASTFTIDKVRRLFDLLGAVQFSGVLDGLKENELKTLAKRLDKHNPDVAPASADKIRKLLIALADQRVAPADKAPPPPKPPKPTKSPRPTAGKKVTRAISSQAMAARWDGTNPDDPKK